MTVFDYILLAIGSLYLGISILDHIITPSNKLRLAKLVNPPAAKAWVRRQQRRGAIFMVCFLIVAYRVWG